MDTPLQEHCYALSLAIVRYSLDAHHVHETYGCAFTTTVLA